MLPATGPPFNARSVWPSRFPSANIRLKIRPTRQQTGERWNKMAEKEIFCAFQCDLDAVAGWLGTYGGEDSPDDISRGMFAGEVGTPRLLNLFEEYDLKTTWFVPAHSIETFPEQCKMVVDAGHEV